MIKPEWFEELAKIFNFQLSIDEVPYTAKPWTLQEVQSHRETSRLMPRACWNPTEKPWERDGVEIAEEKEISFRESNEREGVAKWENAKEVLYQKLEGKFKYKRPS